MDFDEPTEYPRLCENRGIGQNGSGCGYIFEHRVVAENAIDRLLTADEIVHRKNGLKSDSRPEKSEVEINSIAVEFV
jgi:hypothetical protein